MDDAKLSDISIRQYNQYEIEQNEDIQKVIKGQRKSKVLIETLHIEKVKNDVNLLRTH